MQTRMIAACITGTALAAFAGGILFEHYVGTNAAIDWTGLRDRMIVHQVRSTAGRTPVTLPVSAPGRTMVALVFGQSNAGNSGESLGSPHPGVYEFYRGRFYAARDPLLGARGDGGSVWLPFAAKAIASGEFDSVVLVAFAVGASEIARWAPGGSLHDGLLSAIAGARDSGLTFTHLLWQQGEADALARTSGKAYRESFMAMLDAIRRQGVSAPIHVARASRCGKIRPSEEIRSAQSALADPALGIVAGPDTDALGFGERYDGCHFSTEGLDHAAELWLGTVQAGRQARVPR
jgi:hypothetical protein